MAGSDVTTLKHPIIDFSSLKPETPEWDLVKAQVRKGLQEFGYFEAIFEKVPIDLRRAIFETAKELFDLPLETKQLNTSKKPYHGYLAHPAVPLYESLAIDESENIQNVESVASVLWPQGNPSFCNTIQSYSKQLSELDHLVRKIILESLGIEKYMEEHMGSTSYLLRVMKYKGPQTSDPKMGLLCHTDKNFVTILSQNQVEGLEVQTKDGHWVSVNFSPNSFLVMIGDALHAWVNGHLYSSKHRVMIKGSQDRFAIALFSIPKGGYVIKAPPKLVDEEHPLLFKPFDYIDFLEFYSTLTGQRDESALKAYCGV